MHPTHVYGRGEQPRIISLKFRAAGLSVKVFTGPDPYLVAEVPAHEGHVHHGPSDGEHGPRVWLAPDAAPMCCCEDWWTARECKHLAVAQAVISDVAAVTW